MKKLLTSGWRWIAVLLVSQAATAQVMVRASVDRDAIRIGEPLVLQVELHAPLGTAVNWTLPDSIPDFVILRRGTMKQQDDVDGKKWSQELTLTGFDSGRWVIPPIALKVGRKQYASDSITITVSYAPGDLSQPYHDIKTVEAVAAPAFNWWPWAIGGLLALAAAALVLWWLRGRKKIPEPVELPPLSAYEEAMAALEKLKSGADPAADPRSWYTRLNDIFRIYIARQLHISSMERTNDELILQLKKYLLEAEEYRNLAGTLRRADLVKFARMQAGQSDFETDFRVLQSAIRSLNKIS